MGISPDDQHAADTISAMIAETGARFAYGALAAGADILIAEAMLRQGGELHVILPISPSAFKAQSVEPYGEGWPPRFDALMARAVSVEIVDNGERLSAAAIELAAVVAKGRAIDNAARLESQAVPVDIADRADSSTPIESPEALKLNRSAATDADIELQNRQLVFIVAISKGADTRYTRFGRHGEPPIAIPDGAVSVAETIRLLRAANSEATIAIHALIAEDDGVDSITAVKMERLVQAAAPATVIATASAAMLMKATEPDLWIEPLGELPDAAGALSIYALGISV